MYDKSIWLKSLHNLFKIREFMTSEQAYRLLIDNIDMLDNAFDGGHSPETVYEEWDEYNV